MIQIKEAVVVEGKYDKIKLSSILDTVIITTEGFSVFKDKEKQMLIRKLAATRGIVILTDSDHAGFQIRSFLVGSLPKEQVKHAYIPDIYGKEKRKDAPSKEGKLGVEGIPVSVLLESLRRAGVTCGETETPSRRITKLDLFEDGFSGRADSKKRKKTLLKYLDLPENLSSNALVDVLNIFLTYEEYRKAVENVNNREENE